MPTSFDVTAPSAPADWPTQIPFPADAMARALNALDSQNLLQETISLTSAEILALSTVPKELIPAPGASKIAFLDWILIEMTRTATAYANGGVLEVRYENTSGALAAATFPASLVTGAAGVAYAYNIGLATILTPLVNKAIVLNNATAPFITGTGTMRALVGYHILNL